VQQQVDAVKQQYARAEVLRGEAAGALARVQAALARGGDPIAAATEAHAKLEELRELFFSVVEHLQELLREQGETRDRTATARAKGALESTPLLPPLVDRETQHAALGQAIQDALAAQADAAGQAQGAQGADAAKKLADAVEEVREAVGEMQGARDQLVQARDATAASYDLAPTLERQAAAIQHLAAALRLLAPPKQNRDGEQQQQQQQQGGQQGGQDPQDSQGKPGGDDQPGRDGQDGHEGAEPEDGQGDPSSDDNPSGALQELRDEQARRYRESAGNRRDTRQPEPVEKDW
jgi:hypothetical protein